MKKIIKVCIDCDSTRHPAFGDSESADWLRKAAWDRDLPEAELVTSVQTIPGVTSLHSNRESASLGTCLSQETTSAAPVVHAAATSNITRKIEVNGLAVSLAMPSLKNISEEWVNEFTKARSRWKKLTVGRDVDLEIGSLSIKNLPMYRDGTLRVRTTSISDLERLNARIVGSPRSGACRAPEGLKWFTHESGGFPDGKKRYFDPDAFFLYCYLYAFGGYRAPDFSITVNHFDISTTFDLGFARDPYVDPPGKYIWESPIEIGSSEKLLTAIVVARVLCEQGVDPDSPIEYFLPYDTRKPKANEWSLQPHFLTMTTSWRHYLNMLSGTWYWGNRVDPLFSGLPKGQQSVQGYRYLQLDPTPGRTNEEGYDYSNPDYAAIRYPLYHLVIGVRFAGPVPAGPTAAEWRKFIIDYDYLVADNMVKLMNKYIFNPLKITDVGWGYPEFGYVEGGYDAQKHVPKTLQLFYPVNELTVDNAGSWLNNSWRVKGRNWLVQDRLRGAGYGSIHISTKSFCKIVSALAKGQLVNDYWRSVLQKVETSKEYSNRFPVLKNYACAMHESYTHEGKKFWHSSGGDRRLFEGRNYGLSSRWIIFPYADVQAFMVTNHAKYIHESNVIKAYRKAWDPEL